MPIKIGFISLGCPKNLIDTEYMLGDINGDENFKITSNPNLADVVVINTCAFIESAKQEAIETILEFVEKKKNGLKAVVVTGCLAKRYKNEIKKHIPEVDIVLDFNSQKNLKQTIIDFIKPNEKYTGCINSLKKRFLSTPNHYAYLKIADGCNKFCSYCAIPYIRGRYRSRTIEDILKEAKWLINKNVKELIIIAQDTTYYGFDLYKKLELKTLLEKLSKLNFKWIRFLYAYPENIDMELIEVVASNNNIIPYFDIPIQHINNDILKQMNRKTTSEKILKTINLIRKNLPNSTLRTTLITGFPGETNAQFEELLNFVKYIKFDRLGCFTYSKEEGTKAATFPNQIDLQTKKHRTKLIYKESEKIINDRAKSLINKEVETIIDYKKDNFYVGRTKADAPEIDCSVFIKSEKTLNLGDIIKVKVKSTKNADLFGITF